VDETQRIAYVGFLICRQLILDVRGSDRQKAFATDGVDADISILPVSESWVYLIGHPVPRSVTFPALNKTYRLQRSCLFHIDHAIWRCVVNVESSEATSRRLLAGRRTVRTHLQPVHTVPQAAVRCGMLVILDVSSKECPRPDPYKHIECSDDRFEDPPGERQ
jgi:hypothetical protein